MDPRARYNRFSVAEQQQVYKEEIDRIWNNQIRSLTSKEEPFWDDDLEDIQNEKMEDTQKVFLL